MSREPRIAVVGVGAIGGAVAAALGDAGRAPDLCVRTPFRRLRRTLDGDTREYDHPVLTDASGLAPVDWVVLCTKAHQVAGAGGWLERLIGPDTRVAVLQNGVEHVEQVRDFVEPSRVLPGVLLMPVASPSPGVVEQGRAGVIQVPETVDAPDFAALFAGQQAATVAPVADFVSAAWSKLVLNAAGGAICSLVLQPLGAMGHPAVRDLATGLIEEIMAVGRAEGAVFPEDLVARTFDHFTTRIAAHWTSIAVDRREGRSMEWQARNAVVGRIGRRHGIETPLNDALTSLLALADAGAPAPAE